MTPFAAVLLVSTVLVLQPSYGASPKIPTLDTEFAAGGLAGWRGDRFDIRSFGAIPDTDISAGDGPLASALKQCATNRGIVYIPTGYWIISKSSSIPYGCRGVVGDGPASEFVLTKNVAVLHIAVTSGQPVSGFTLDGLSATVQIPGVTTQAAADATHLLYVDGASAGISYSTFRRLFGYGTTDLIGIHTATITTANGQENQSGWNDFEDFSLNVGGTTGAVLPYAQVRFYDGTSTGNQFHNFRGPASEAFIRAEGDGAVCGDVLISGFQVGLGRVASLGSKTVYNRNWSLDGVQVDAQSTEAIKFETPLAIAPNNFKIQGSTLGGSSPWQNLPPLTRSVVSDLGESRWAAGGPINGGDATLGAQTRQLWHVFLGGASNLSGGTTLDVQVNGLLGGVDAVMVSQRFYLTYASFDQTINIASDAPKAFAAHSGKKLPAGFPTISVTQASGSTNVDVSVSYTARKRSSALETTIAAEGGAMKITRGADVSF